MFLEKIGKALLGGYQKEVFKASSHGLYIYEPHGKGKNNAESIGGRPQSPVRSPLDATARSCQELMGEWPPLKCAGGWQRCSTSLDGCSGNGETPGWMAPVGLPKWSKAKAWRGQEELFLLRGNISWRIIAFRLLLDNRVFGCSCTVAFRLTPPGSSCAVLPLY